MDSNYYSAPDDIATVLWIFVFQEMGTFLIIGFLADCLKYLGSSKLILIVDKLMHYETKFLSELVCADDAWIDQEFYMIDFLSCLRYPNPICNNFSWIDSR